MQACFFCRSTSLYSRQDISIAYDRSAISIRQSEHDHCSRCDLRVAIALCVIVQIRVKFKVELVLISLRKSLVDGSFHNLLISFTDAYIAYDADLLWSLIRSAVCC